MSITINTNGKTVWQISAGDNSRSYEDLFIDFGIAMLGPGNPGSVAIDLSAYEDKKYGNHIEYIKRLRDEVKVGDLIIIKSGRSIIKYVGIVKSQYNYSDMLRDVYGWDLQHYIEVEWYKPDKDIDLQSNILAIARLNRVYDKKILDAIDTATYNQIEKSTNLNDLEEPTEIGFDEIKQALIDNGVRIHDAYSIVDTINKIIDLAKWYINNNPQVLEHEIRTFLVIPLLIALGWSEQKIKVEYKKLDVALYKVPFVNESQSPFLIVETKTFGNGLFWAANQVQNYADEYRDCNILVTTNGLQYRVYERNSNDEKFKEIGYMNLLDLRKWFYLNKKIKGADFCLMKLSGFSNI